MFPDFKSLVEIFERLSLDNTAYSTYQNQENFKVCLYYQKNFDNKNWSIWFAEQESHSKQIVASQHLHSVLTAFKIKEEDFIIEMSNRLLVQAAFADEFIRQVSELLGKQAVQKSILETQNFMDELGRCVTDLFKKETSVETKKNKNRLKLIK